MFVESIEVLGTGLGVIDLSQRLFPTFKRLFRLVKNGELRIAIFGAGGTGKTTLGKILSGEFEGAFDLLPSYRESLYRESLKVERYNLGSNLVGSIIVAPGQERREDTWDDILRLLSSGKIALVINVVSWGYHSFGAISYKEHSLYRPGATPEQFLERYLNACRDRELAVLEKIAPFLTRADRNRKTMMITLVTKQDLWWEQRTQVREHYITGSCDRILQAIQATRGTANFTHEYCSASLVMENFVSGTNEMLAATTGGYDRRLQLVNLQSFLQVLKSLGKT